MSRTPGSLRVLLANLIDYAGLYPPAALPLPSVTANYARYLASHERWVLNRLILPAARLGEAQCGAGWRISLLVDGDPGPLPPQVETLETRQDGTYRLPTYYEAPLDRLTRGFAKIRTGGVTPEAIPAAGEVAAFLFEAARRRIPFKATAGLHHPLRSEQPLTYAADAPRAVMHGFLNVFVAAGFAWQGAEPSAFSDVVSETDPHAFEFRDDGMLWRGLPLSTSALESARRDFAHSFGSCSFDEPIAGLRALDLPL